MSHFIPNEINKTISSVTQPGLPKNNAQEENSLFKNYKTHRTKTFASRIGRIFSGKLHEISQRILPEISRHKLVY